MLTDEVLLDAYGISDINDMPDLHYIPLTDEERADQEAYMVLVKNIYELSKPAGSYLEDQAMFLDSFQWDGDLRKCFMWEETERGKDYWARLNKRLENHLKKQTGDK